MSGEIVNRVANSKLITFDLEDFFPEGERRILDISDWLFEGFILKEKEFRESVKQHQWDQYLNQYVAITCSSDAIIPSWAYLLISTALAPFAKKFVVGNLNLLENMIFQEVISSIPLEQFTNVPVIIKGCSNKQIPDTAYVLMCQRLVPVVSSLMFGEACSSVPLFKKKK